MNYTATSATRVVGDNDGGSVVELQAQDELNFDSGETASGLEVVIGLGSSKLKELPLRARIFGHYQGTAGHVVGIYAWNYQSGA